MQPFSLVYAREKFYAFCLFICVLFCLRLRHFEQQIEKSSREYNMEKLTALKTDVDEATRKFEECQDAYATSMYDFINREQEFTDKIQRVGGWVGGDKGGWVWSCWRWRRVCGYAGSIACEASSDLMYVEK